MVLNNPGGRHIAVLCQYDAALSAGALVVVEEKKSRARVLPL
jgi:hypothetical protein